MATDTRDAEAGFMFEMFASHDYDGEELGCNGRREYGYLRVNLLDRVRLYRVEPSPGHWMNRFPDYVFGIHTGDRSQGWLPRRCLEFRHNRSEAEIVGDYDGNELLAAGYIPVKRGERFTIIGSPVEGEAYNRSWLYVFGVHTYLDKQGWFPASCLESLPFPYSQSSMMGSMNLGSRAGRRKIQYIECERMDIRDDDYPDLYQSLVKDAIVSTRPVLTFPWIRTTLVASTIISFLGEPSFACRSVCRSWSLCCHHLVGLRALQVKTAALFSESAPVAIARCINKIETLDTVCVPWGGGCIQRRRALLTIRDIHSRLSRHVVYLLRGFFGFFSADDEAEERELLQSLRSSGINVFSECAIELHPGANGRVFVTDLLESTWMTREQIVRVYFRGGEEILSLGLKNNNQDTFRISRLSYQVVVADDPHDDSQTFLHIPPIEDRLLTVLVYQDVSLDVVIAPGDINLPPITIPIRHVCFCSDIGFHRPSLYQRVQLFGSSTTMQDGSSGDSWSERVLMSTGWLHVAGPDGSVGASIIGDFAALDFGPIHELAERATGLRDFDNDIVELGCEAFNRTSHVVRFRTLPVGDEFRSIVHVHTGSSFHVLCKGHPKTDAFVLGSLRNSKVEARKAAAVAAMSLLQDSALYQPFPRLPPEEE